MMILNTYIYDQNCSFKTCNAMQYNGDWEMNK